VAAWVSLAERMLLISMQPMPQLLNIKIYFSYDSYIIASEIALVLAIGTGTLNNRWRIPNAG
jgi:hypothetical protein